MAASGAAPGRGEDGGRRGNVGRAPDPQTGRPALGAVSRDRRRWAHRTTGRDRPGRALPAPRPSGPRQGCGRRSRAAHAVLRTTPLGVGTVAVLARGLAQLLGGLLVDAFALGAQALVLRLHLGVRLVHHALDLIAALEQETADFRLLCCAQTGQRGQRLRRGTRPASVDKGRATARALTATKARGRRRIGFMGVSAGREGRPHGGQTAPRLRTRGAQTLWRLCAIFRRTVCLPHRASYGEDPRPRAGPVAPPRLPMPLRLWQRLFLVLALLQRRRPGVFRRLAAAELPPQLPRLPRPRRPAAPAEGAARLTALRPGRLLGCAAARSARLREFLELVSASGHRRARSAGAAAESDAPPGRATPAAAATARPPLPEPLHRVLLLDAQGSAWRAIRAYPPTPSACPCCSAGTRSGNCTWRRCRPCWMTSIAALPRRNGRTPWWSARWCCWAHWPWPSPWHAASWRRCRRWRRAPDALAAGDYAQRVATDRCDELGALARDFNRPGRDLEQNRNARRQWGADIAHELRTPLAILRGEIDALHDGVRAPTPQALASLQAECQRLATLVDDLYQLSLADAGALDYRFERLDLAALARDTVALQAGAFGAAGPGWKVEAPASAPVRADARRLAQLLDNLLGNARRYTDAPGRVLVLRVAASAAEVVLSVDDTAPGVARRPAAPVRAAVPRGRLAQPRQRRRWGSAWPSAVPSSTPTAAHRRAALGAGRPQRARGAARSGSRAVKAGRVLIVEDRPKLAALLRDYLQAAGFATEIVGDGEAAVASVRRAARPMRSLLDLMLPGKDGLSVCREVRAFCAVPIPHGHRAGGDRPPARPGARRRRLHLQALQPARGGGAGEGGAATRAGAGSGHRGHAAAARSGALRGACRISAWR